jgi:hypothetical protein
MRSSLYFWERASCAPSMSQADLSALVGLDLADLVGEGGIVPDRPGQLLNRHHPTSERTSTVYRKYRTSLARGNHCFDMISCAADGIHISARLYEQGM